MWTIMMNPLDQFIVRPVFGNFKFGINTFTLDTILVAGVAFWVFYLLLVSNKNLSHLYTFAIGPGLKTLSYGAVVGSKRYRPLYVFVFVLIAMSNVMGLIPFSLTSTSFAVMTFFAGLTMFIGINIIALASYNWKFVNLFLPSGAPLAIAPFLIIIETISYFARVMSLSIRLFANLLAVHALMKIIGTFVWSTPLIIAIIISSLHPIADTRSGLAESFGIFVSQLCNLWHISLSSFNSVVEAGDNWLYMSRIPILVGVDMAVDVILNYVALMLVVFVSVCALLFMVGCYLQEELGKTLVDLFAASKNSVWFKLVWLLYGFRAWFLSFVVNLKPADFSTQRQLGVIGMLSFVWAALKFVVRNACYSVLTLILRGSAVQGKVNFAQIREWNTYVAPVFSVIFWWIVVALDLTYLLMHVLQFVGFAHSAGLSFTWSDVLTSKLLFFGIFGSGLFLAIVLSVLILGDFVMACWTKVAPSSGVKVSEFFNGPACFWTDILGIIIVGLLVGFLQLVMYYNLFDMAFISTYMPQSLVFGALVRIGHFGFSYIVLAIVLIYIFAQVSAMITVSMDSAETRNYMQWFWYYGPVVVFGLISFDILYMILKYDLLLSAKLEACMISIINIIFIDIAWNTPYDFWNAWVAMNNNHLVGYNQAWDIVWNALNQNDYNAGIVVVLSALSGVSIFVEFVGNVCATTLYYFISEVDAILLAGFNSLVSVVALLLVPLITPLAWIFLLAITGLEMVIILLQAYVFITLSSMYLNDVIKLH
jgi:ATP synthase subunit 6